MSVPVLIELDENDESSGAVHFYCSNECRRKGRNSPPLGLMTICFGDSEDAIEQTRCETCGRDIA